MRFNHHASVLAVAGLLLGAVGTAQAQDSTTGAVRGQVRDQSNNEAVIGATVVASGPALQGTQATITDESGQYTIANLPPGTYQVVVYYADAQFSRTNVLIQLGKVAKVNIGINTQAQAGETIVIEGRAPLIDQQSTKVGNSIGRDYTENIPTGRTFGAVLGAAGGSQDDFYGTSLSGSTSNENTYIVEGVNTTDPGFGLLSTNLPNEFIQETEVITGGYNAEYGRSTGGIINVITKSGSNEFHGSVFGYWTPGALVANQKATPSAGAAIAREDNLSNEFDLGAEVGGPIIKDRLWFHVGFNPSFRSEEVTRVLSTQVDQNGDGVADTDENGFNIIDEVDRRKAFDETRDTYYYSAKLTGAVTPDHQGSLAVLGSPSTRDEYGDTIDGIVGAKSVFAHKRDKNVLDTNAKWTSKFFDNKTQIDAVAGYHLDDDKESPGIEGAGEANRIQHDFERPITDFMAAEQQFFGGVPDACVDGGAGDPYPDIVNCPVPEYSVGGEGFSEDQKATRISGMLSVTQRVQALGHHVVKAGVDIEQQGFLDQRHYSNGALYQERTDELIQITRFSTPSPNGTLPCGIDYDGDDMTEAQCRQIEGDDQLSADTQTRNYGAYLQDSWSILPNLTLNAGLRWEQQNLYVADNVAGQVSPATGSPIPDVAFKLKNLLAPRVGLVYDWTQEGRSKLFGHWGRFYESIPMDINSRAYGGEVININYIDPALCDPFDPVGDCNETDPVAAVNFGGHSIVDPGLDAQYLDEMVFGAEYEILPDLKIGASYIRRDLGRVIEDVSTDGGNTYIIANPGDANEAEVADLRRQAMETSNVPDQNFLRDKADFFEGVGTFDEPKRTYNALQITAERRFTKDFFLSASYTYSENRGNYPGLFSHETDQLDPNLTSLFDLPELMANRYGDIGSDRPHLVKLDGFYRLTLDPTVGFFTFGASLRAQSGLPINTLAAHPGYGTDESYLLPRGAGGRMGLTTRADAHVAYGRNLTDGTRLEAFVDLFNVFNQQPEVEVDETYTLDDSNPIVGGDKEDLEHAKVLYTGQRVNVNQNYGNTSDRQLPFSARFGVRLLF